MRRIAIWFAGLLANLFCLMPLAQAQTSADYTQGVEFSGNTAKIWFKPSPSVTSWVVVHYNLNSTGAQNLGMTWNAASARYEQSVTPVAVGNTLRYNFTY